MIKGPPGNCVYVGSPMVYQPLDKTVPHLLEPLGLTRCPRLKGHFFFFIFYSKNQSEPKPEFVPQNIWTPPKPDLEALPVPGPPVFLVASMMR